MVSLIFYINTTFDQLLAIISYCFSLPFYSLWNFRMEILWWFLSKLSSGWR